MKKLGAIVLLLGMQLLLSGQPDIQWHKTYGGSLQEDINCIIQTEEEGYIASGPTISWDGHVGQNNGTVDYWIIKMDAQGGLEWSKTYGGSEYDWPLTIRQTQEGGYVVAGFTQSSNGDVAGFHGETDSWILKIDSQGQLEWKKSVGGTGREESRSIELTNDGGYIVTGFSNSSDGDLDFSGKGGLDFWVSKLDSNGNIEWQKKLGGDSNESAWDISPTDDGGFVITGETFSNNGDVFGNEGDYDIWVVKLDHLGQIEWQNCLGGTGTDIGYDITQIEDGFIVCGITGSSNGDVTGYHGNYDMWVLKLDNDGQLIWQNALGGSNADYGREFIIEDDDSIVITGSTKSNDGDVKGLIGLQMVWLVKLNSDGELIWQKVYGGTQGEDSKTICATADGGFAIGGYTWSEDGDLAGQTLQGQNDAWLIKFAPESTFTTQAHHHHLELFPNPATHTVFLNTPQYEERLQAIVTDLIGRELYRQKVNSFDGLEVSSLSKGLYLVEAIGEGGVRYVGKLLKQ